MSRRTLFLHVTPTEPVAATPTTFTAAAGITLTNGTLTGTVTGSTSPNAPCMKSAVGVSAGAVYWETTVTYTGAASNIEVGFGMSTASVIYPLGQDLGGGEATRSGGVNCRTGLWFKGGAGAASGLGVIASGSVVRHWLDLDAKVYKMAVNGGAFVTVASGLSFPNDTSSFVPVYGDTLYAMASFANTAGSTCSVTFNMGATPWVYGLPAGGVKYIGSANAPNAIPLKLASRTVVPVRAGLYLTQFDLYDGRINAKADPTLSIQASAWPQGGGASGGNPVVGALEFWNGDHALDVWSNYTWRDVLAELFYTEGELVDDAETRGVWGRAKVDRVEFKEDTVRMVFADVLAQLDRPAQANTYGTQAAAGVTLNRSLAEVGTQNEGRALPLCLGIVAQADPWNVNPAPGVREYQWSDGPVTEVTAVYDKCDPFDELTTGVDIRRTSQTDGFRMAPSIAGPIGKVTADLIGLYNRSTRRVNPATDGSFTTWAGSPTTPSGWARAGAETAGTKITNAGGAARLQSDGTSPWQGLLKTALIPAGAYIEIQFDVTTVTTPGPIYFRLAGSVVVNRRVDITAAGTYRVTMQNTGASTANFLILTSLAGADVSNVVIDNLGVWDVLPILRLSDMLTHLATVRGPLLSTDINAATVNALAGKFNPRLGYYGAEQANTLELVRQLLDSFAGFIYADQNMKLGVGRLEDVSLATATLSLTEADIIGSVVREFDAARSLSTNLAGKRNASPTDGSSMATSVSAADKQRWSAAFQYVRSALNRVASAYANADKAAPFPTWLVDEADVLAEVSRVATLYSVQRYFYRVTVSLDTAAAVALNPGDVISLTAGRYDLAAGRRLLCLGVTRRFFSSAVDLILWG